MSLVKQVADALPDAETWTNHRGQEYAGARNGSRLVMVSPLGQGEVRVTLWITYDDDQRSWCDSRNFRTARGALRMAREHLKIEEPS